jgi:serine O-acetyltransferase
MDMKTWQKDLYRYEGEKSEKLLVKLKYIFFVPGFTYTYLFRKSQSGLGGGFFRVLLKITSYITHIQIPPNTRIGEGLYIGHYGAIIINPGAVIGRNFSIAAGTLIGNAQGKKQGVPTIGDNVYMGRNAIVIGGVNIGNNVMIAPGAFVNFDVPDNSIVIGNPGKIISRESSPTEKYMVYTV